MSLPTRSVSLSHYDCFIIVDIVVFISVVFDDPGQRKKGPEKKTLFWDILRGNSCAYCASRRAPLEEQKYGEEEEEEEEEEDEE